MYFLLALIDFLSPKARGSRRVARGVAYGPDARQRLDVYAPSEGDGPWPVIYFLYGGSWSDGERGYYAFMARRLAAAGYVVVVPDYRLVPAVEYPAFLEDCARGFGWLGEHVGAYGGDSGRVAVMGHSAGAYNAAMLVLKPGLLDDRALASIKALLGLSGPFDFYPLDVPISIRVFGAVRDGPSTQPVRLVRPSLPPAFLGHGDRDTLVQPRNTVALAAAWRAAGNVVEERHYAGVGHPTTLMQLGALGWRGPVLRDVLAFLAAHL